MHAVSITIKSFGQTSSQKKFDNIIHFQTISNIWCFYVYACMFDFFDEQFNKRQECNMYNYHNQFDVTNDQGWNDLAQLRWIKTISLLYCDLIVHRFAL